MQTVQPASWRLGTYWSDRESHSLTALKEAGFDCIELNLDNYQSLSETLKQENYDRYNQAVLAAKEVGLDIWSVHLPFGDLWDISLTNEVARAAVVEANVQVMDWAQGWGANCVVIHPSFEPISDEEHAGRLEAARDSIRILSGKAAERMLCLAVEDLPRSCLGKHAEEILALIADASEAVVCCDTNHLLGETPEYFIRTVGSRIQTLHVSDYDGIDEKHWIPGRGIVNWAEVLQALVDIGYEGPFMFEAEYQDPKDVVTSFHAIVAAYEALVKSFR
ncbi:sugar phosphate isomerase/epimerase family protein [Paenibacillus terrigena]|uniref:sugar phosphate isomerase/epimerase family protein n=1 Tax=Paenibacillus terrigena TaxID=369333 RepID=UPI0003604B28|nr:sugar phosphate isomerase/epimerase family protein [Paenibacillus terrigena]